MPKSADKNSISVRNNGFWKTMNFDNVGNENFSHNLTVKLKLQRDIEQ